MSKGKGNRSRLWHMTDAAKPVLVAVAWPYANGPLHLGHIAGAYLPADIFARYHRMIGNDVLMVSGSDAHGTPITVRADEEGVTPREVVQRFHPQFLGYWRDLGISFDLFTTTMTENHAETTQLIFSQLYDNGFIAERTTKQFYDPDAGKFLPDRYVEGTCPLCGATGARGDQCDACGKTLDATDLIDPRSKLTGAVPELKDTAHYFILLSKLEAAVSGWLETRTGWRSHVINWANGFIGDGLHDRAITRDITWGVPLPDGVGLAGAENKRIYVWFEAVVGYLSASIEWAKSTGDPDAWERWWKNDAAESYYFVGKDNIPFHAVYWPAQLIGAGGYNLPTNVPANQYVTFKGAKASKSLGIGKSVTDYLEVFTPDALRYALAMNLPESNDVDLTDEEMARRVNDELAATWGNLVNRVFTMVQSMAAGKMPIAPSRDGTDETLIATVKQQVAETGVGIAAVELRVGLRAAMRGAQAVNVYLNELAPWKTAKTDSDRTLTTLHVAVEAISWLNVAFAPYLPFSAAAIDELCGFDGDFTGRGMTARIPHVGKPLGIPTPLFPKIEG